MTRLEKIERDIEALEPAEFARFREWFATFDAARWERSFDEDASSGALDGFADAAVAAHRAGRTRAL